MPGLATICVLFSHKANGEKAHKYRLCRHLPSYIGLGLKIVSRLILKTRSIITVVALMAQGITDSSLKFHLQNAKDHGVTQKEIAAIITHVAFYAGWPKGWAVFNLAKEVWNEDETE